jgi:hypothetical protein
MKFILFVFILFTLVGCARHPNDSEMNDLFRKDFVALSNIVVKTGGGTELTRIEWDGASIIVDAVHTNPPLLSASLSPHMNAIGRPLLVIRAGDPAQVLFCYSRRGLSVSGSMKGVAYQETVPKSLVQNTDAYLGSNAPLTVFKTIQPNWYIFYSK